LEFGFVSDFEFRISDFPSLREVRLMRAYLTLTRRELAGYLLSITGYVIIAAAVFLMGLSFVVILIKLQGRSETVPVTELFYMTPFFWLMILLLVPVITMRLFAGEKSSGTFETLMTTPVGDLEVVAAKFTAALVFYTIMWLPLLAFIFILQRYAGETGGLDAGVIGTTFLGIILLGSLFISLGCFASALTRSQMTAAMISLVFSISLFLLSVLPDRLPAGDWGSQVLSYFALFYQMHDFSRGVLDTRPVVLYLALSYFFLFLTVRVVESRRWK
jgi:ABC-2 type transport system permease protein